MNPLAPGAAPAQNAMVPKQQGAAPMPLRDAIRGLNLNQSQLAKEIASATYAAQEFGTLARNPNVSHKDVINAAAKAVADGQITPTAAVDLLAQVPPDADKLKPWLDHQYAMSLGLSVHLKAEAMGYTQPGAPPQGAPPAAPMAPAQPNPNAAPAPGNAPEPVTTGA